MDAITLISGHEGERLKVYVDTRGKRSIGIGRNLDDKGISHEEALMLFQRDYTESLNEALKYPWYNDLNEPRQAVIVDMIFEMGAAKFKKFVLMQAAIVEGDYARAAAQMLNSAWCSQVPQRAQQDAQIMDTGAWPSV